MDLASLLQDNEILQTQYVFNLMQRYKTALKFFDIRDQASYNQVHIRNSIRVPIESEEISPDLLKQITKERELSRLRRNCIIIAYDPIYSQQAQSFSFMLETLKCKEVHSLINIEDFIARYSFLCSNFRKIAVKDFPNEIIPRFLYLGSQEHALCRDVIETLKVTHICNVTRETINLFTDIKYCRVYVDDKETEKISLFFKKAYEFIEDAFDGFNSGEKNVVLVHCAKGVSRSATIVIMFLMRAYGMGLDQALGFVKRHREIIEPNEGFMNELKKFQMNNLQFLRRSSTNYNGLGKVRDYNIIK